MSTAIQRRGGTTAQHASFTGLAREITIDTDKNTVVVHDGSTAGGFPLATEASIHSLFCKKEPLKVAWTKTGNGTAETQTDIYVEVDGLILTIDSGTSINMPTLAAGTDYAIWVAPDGTLEADTSFTTPPTANGRRIGGFHYAPGGNATGTSGGNSTAQINEYSFHDLKFRPACDDPRGMTLVAGGFWADIYLLNTNPDVNGTSSFGKTIADGSSPPIIPAAFGGNGSTNYGSFKWYECQEVFAAYGKKAPTYAEFMALAYGVTEETDRGSDPGTTQLDAARTSKWGVIQATGNLWVWGRDVIADGTGSGAWRDIAEGRGEIYTYNADLRAGRFGGDWNVGAQAGSRSSIWVISVANSFNSVSGRGVCDHLVLD